MRRSISAPYREFKTEIERLERLDDENQRRLSPSPTRPKSGDLSKRQLFLLNEGVFFSGFRAYENFLEDIFILYTLKKRNNSGYIAISFLDTGNFAKNRDIVKSTNRFIDWTDPDTVISRAHLFLKDGDPIAEIIMLNKTVLKEMKWIRNHIAHNAIESKRQYINVIQTRLTTVPLKIPTVGEFLNMSISTRPDTYYLREYLSALSDIAHNLVN